MILSAREFLSEYLSENLSVRLTRRTLVFWQEWTECVSAFYYFIESRELSVLATVSNLQLNQDSDRGVVWLYLSLHFTRTITYLNKAPSAHHISHKATMTP